MEFISSSQHEKYKAVIDKIDEAFKKREQLKVDVENEDNKLVAVRLAAENHLLKNKISVFVKVYSSIFDVSFIYSEDLSQSELNALPGYSNNKLYVIEVTVANIVWQKLNTQKLLLHVHINNSMLSVHKTISLHKRPSPFIVVVPFDKSTELATVCTELYISHGNTWCNLYSCTKNIDISYHFTTLEKSWNENFIIKIAQQYHPNLKDIFRNKCVDYKFKCKCTLKHFFESLVKNCYHRLNPEIFSAFTDKDATNVSTSFTVDGNNTVVIKLDQLQNVLSVNCNLYDLECVKKYFISEMQCKEASVDKMWLVALTNLKHYLRAEVCEHQAQCKDAVIIYEELQKLKYDLYV